MKEIDKSNSRQNVMMAVLAIKEESHDRCTKTRQEVLLHFKKLNAGVECPIF